MALSQVALSQGQDEDEGVVYIPMDVYPPELIFVSINHGVDFWPCVIYKPEGALLPECLQQGHNLFKHFTDKECVEEWTDT